MLELCDKIQLFWITYLQQFKLFLCVATRDDRYLKTGRPEFLPFGNFLTLVAFFKFGLPT
jgi:hypothetical protein